MAGAACHSAAAEPALARFPRRLWHRVGTTDRTTVSGHRRDLPLAAVTHLARAACGRDVAARNPAGNGTSFADAVAAICFRRLDCSPIIPPIDLPTWQPLRHPTLNHYLSTNFASGWRA